MNLDHLKTKHQLNVEKTMKWSNQTLPGKPTVLSDADRKFRANLIFEEVRETILDGLGIGISFYNSRTKERFYVPMNDNGSDWVIEYNILADMDMVQTIDGCCDIHVVTTGLLSACGIPDSPFQMIVDQSNLDKFVNGKPWKIRDDGKYLKPPGWQPPDIEGKLNEINKYVHVSWDSGSFEYGGFSPVLDGPGRDIPHGIEASPDQDGLDLVDNELNKLETDEANMDLDSLDITEKFIIYNEETGGPVPKGKYLVVRLDDPDEVRSHAACMAARQFRKLISNEERYKQEGDRIEQMIIAVEEEKPPLKRTSDAPLKSTSA